MEQLAALIAHSHARWAAPVVEATLGTTDPTSVAKMLAEAVSVAINQSVAGARFYEPGVGIVVGLEVADGRAVVAKVHRQSYVTRERLAAIIRVQADLAASGAPAPLPLGGPIALGNGWLTVEELRESDSADGSDPEVRRGMACALWSFVDRARPHVDQASLGAWPAEPVLDDLWPEPHTCVSNSKRQPMVPPG